jgi:anti-sigma factor RsiW
MSCDRIQDLIAGYVDNDLPAADKALVESHCAACADCAGLLAALKDAGEALASFPEVEPSPALLEKLYEIPVRKRGRRWSLGFFLKPSLQPILAAATVFMALVSLYFLNPDRKAFDKAVSREFHRGISRIERLYAEAESVTDSLGAYASNVFTALKALNPLGPREDKKTESKGGLP